MSSTAWIKLNNFNLPLSFKIKCVLSNVFSLWKVNTQYDCKDDTVFIKVVFEGEYLDKVLQNFRLLMEEWSRQNNIQM